MLACVAECPKSSSCEATRGSAAGPKVSARKRMPALAWSSMSWKVGQASSAITRPPPANTSCFAATSARTRACTASSCASHQRWKKNCSTTTNFLSGLADSASTTDVRMYCTAPLA